MTEFDEAFVRKTIEGFFRRSQAIQAAGGIPLQEVIDGVKTVPEGWRLDQETDFYIPPNLQLDTTDTVQ